MKETLFSLLFFLTSGTFLYLVQKKKGGGYLKLNVCFALQLF